MKKPIDVMREVFCRKSALGGILVFLVLFAATGAAAPAGKARANKTVFNPSTAKPVWASTFAATRPDSMLIDAMQQIRVTGDDKDDPLVIVPARPSPRSPFMPPSQLSLDDLPPWVQVGDP